MIRQLLFVLVLLATALGVAHATQLTFNGAGIAMVTVDTLPQGGNAEQLAFEFAVPNIDGVTLSGVVIGLCSDILPYCAFVDGATVLGAGSYVFSPNAPSFFALSQTYLTQGDWQLLVDVVTAPLGGSVTIFASATPSPFVSGVPEPAAINLVLA